MQAHRVALGNRDFGRVVRGPRSPIASRLPSASASVGGDGVGRRSQDEPVLPRLRPSR